MQPTPVIAIFDVGKTNKKLLLFDEGYRIVYQEGTQLADIKDEDGFPCEDLMLLSAWITETYRKLLQRKDIEVRAVNFSAYGASFVHINDNCHPAAPLYNYLKRYPDELQQQFYQQYGRKETFSLQTASPPLGMLNSGLQLYWLKHHKPEVYHLIASSLHLPQYLSYLVTGRRYVDVTSIGCHTGLWDFTKNDYHTWVYAEALHLKFAPVYKGNDVIKLEIGSRQIPVGVGLHDSSAALIPYLLHFQEPFVLISTGTWCISLNPFNQQPLTEEELSQDCLCYLTYEGEPVKAARVFLGYEHEQQVKRIAEHFGTDARFYDAIEFDAAVYTGIKKESLIDTAEPAAGMLKQSPFAVRNLSQYKTATEAYHQLISDLVRLQHASTSLVLQRSPVKRIFVDGGFSKNNVYMNGLAAAFPQMEVYAASMAQASALGAALVVHKHWNAKPIPSNIIELKYYHLTHDDARA